MKTRLVTVASAIVVALANLAIQLKSPGFTDPDGYYHIAWSRILRDGLLQGHLPAFTGLPLTILNPHDYADHHFLFHVFQMPFAWSSDLVLGAKVSCVVFATLAYLACFWLVARRHTRAPFAWAVALLASSLLVLARMGLPRAPAVMLVLFVVAIALLFARRPVWLGVLSFVAVWTYSLFPFLGVFAVLWAVTVWVEERRLEWRPIAAVAIGIVVGLVVNPYFPQNIGLILTHLRAVSPVETAVGSAEGAGVEIFVGTEWAPISGAGLFVLSPVALLAEVFGWAIVVRRFRRAGVETVFLGLASATFFALTLRSVRFSEYWAPLAIVFFAYALAPMLESWTPRRVGVVALAASVVLGAYLALFVAKTDVSGLPSTHPEVYAAAGQWLAANTPEGSLVYNVAYEDFPALYCFDPHNAYVSGLDPTYLAYRDPELALLAEDIETGRVERPSTAIRDRFGARFVIVNVASHAFLDRARTDPGFRLSYSNPFLAVLAIDAPTAGR